MLNPNLTRSFWLAALAIGLTAGGTALIEANKVTTTSADRAPMPVAATRFVQEAGYR